MSDVASSVSVATVATVAAVAAPVPPPPSMQRDDAVPALWRGRLRPLYPLYRAFQLWSDADGLRMAAAMSFYGILSLAPLLVLSVAMLGWWLDAEAVARNISEQIDQLAGPQAAELVRATLSTAQAPVQGVLASLAAFGFLLVGATGVFAELQSAFERLWTQGTDHAPADHWWRSATLRLRGVAYVLAFGFLMLVSLAISVALGWLEGWARTHGGALWLLQGLNFAVLLLITVGLFVGMMRMSAGPQPRLRHLVVGALVGALAFALGRYGLTVYLKTAAVVSAYGAAGSMVVLLMWMYFASAVLLFAAAVARVQAEAQGEYRRSAVPPPAAAITSAQAELRDALESDTAPISAAAVAGALSDAHVATGDDGPAGAPGDAAPPARRVTPLRQVRELGNAPPPVALAVPARSAPGLAMWRLALGFGVGLAAVQGARAIDQLARHQLARQKARRQKARRQKARQMRRQR